MSITVTESNSQITVTEVAQTVTITEASYTVTVSESGPQGPPGPTGPGVAAGGATNDILRKVSSTNYDTAWTDAPTLDAIQFDTAAAEVSAVGKLNWNNDDGTVQIGLLGGNIALNIGQEQLVRIKNTTGSALTKGQVVYIIGAQGQRLTVALARNNTEATSSKTFGLVAESIADQAEGFVVTSGLLRGLNTQAYTEGAPIYLSSTAGQFTLTKPSAPLHMVPLGWIARQGSGSSGSIFVHIQNGFEIEEIHNVAISSVTDQDILAYDSATQTWKNVKITDVGRKALKVITGTTNSTATILAAVTGKRLKVQSYALFTESTALVTATFKSGAGGTSLWSVPMKAITGSVFGANLSSQFPGFLFATSAGQLLELSLSTTADVTYSITYWDEDNT